MNFGILTLLFTLPQILILVITGLIIIIVVGVMFVTRDPRVTAISGAVLIVIGLAIGIIPIIGILIAIVPFLVGVVLMVWGIAEVSAKTKSAKRREIRICTKCGRDLSSLPRDIKRCPYCGNELV